ncbi:hypothetical protein EMIT0P74_90010 [Pseudomonas sp. IT-P74]
MPGPLRFFLQAGAEIRDIAGSDSFLSTNVETPTVNKILRALCPYPSEMLWSSRDMPRGWANARVNRIYVVVYFSANKNHAGIRPVSCRKPQDHRRILKKN